MRSCEDLSTHVQFTRGVSDVGFPISADIGCGYHIFYYTRVMKMSFGSQMIKKIQKIMELIN